MLYIAPEQLPVPHKTSIRFGSSKPIQANIVNPKQLEDGELSDESKSFIPGSPFSAKRPAQIQIKVEQFESTHNAREIENKDESALKAADNSNTSANIQQVPRQGGSSPSHISQQLLQLYNSLHSVFGQQPTPMQRELEKCGKNDSVSSSNSEEEEDEEDGWNTW
jgi:hypothetical protein